MWETAASIILCTWATRPTYNKSVRSYFHRRIGVRWKSSSPCCCSWFKGRIWHSSSIYFTPHSGSPSSSPNTPLIRQSQTLDPRILVSWVSALPNLQLLHWSLSVSFNLAWTTTQCPEIPEHQQFLPSTLSDNSPPFLHGLEQLRLSIRWTLPLPELCYCPSISVIHSEIVYAFY